MKRLSCVISGHLVTKNEIKEYINIKNMENYGIKIPDEIIEFYVNQNIMDTYHRVIKSINGEYEYDIGHFCSIIKHNNSKEWSIIDTTISDLNDDFFGKHHMIIFNTSTGGDLFYVSYGQDDYGKVYFMSMDEGEDVEPVLLANSFGEFIDALEVDPEDMDVLMALPEDRRGDLP